MAKSDTVIQKTYDYVKKMLEGEGSGHDWWHIVRVVGNAKAIAAKEGGDLFVIELAALLHDIADWKFNNGDSTVGARVSREWLSKLGVDTEVIEQVAYIVEHISFKGGTNVHKMNTLESKIVQDADRLDALGAIGIARVFAVGGAFGRTIYIPGKKPRTYDSIGSAHKALKDNTAINHFYEKLLLLKDKMNTKTGKQMAENRHKYMEQYLEQFYAEWEGKK